MSGIIPLTSSIPDMFFSKESPKTWFGVAIAVGVLVLAGGVFSLTGLGLLKFHRLSSASTWFSSAIGTIGSTPHNWSLWLFGVGGVVTGVALVGCGGLKLRQIRIKTIQEQDYTYIKEQFTVQRDRANGEIPRKATEFSDPIQQLAKRLLVPGEYICTRDIPNFINGSKQARVQWLIRVNDNSTNHDPEFLLTKLVDINSNDYTRTHHSLRRLGYTCVCDRASLD